MAAPAFSPEVGAGMINALMRRIGVAGLCLLVDACASTPVPQNPFRQADAPPALEEESVPEPGRPDAADSAEGEDPPVEARGSDGGAPATPVASPVRRPLSVELEVERARAMVLDLARARWTNGRQAASQALSALADMLVAAEASAGLVSEVKELRFQAERLSRMDSSSIGEAGWVKKALTAALHGLDRLGTQERVASSKWGQAARQAVDSIEERSTINLQRAAVQDAFRSTVDAFAAELSAD